jgi:hypothetical protein
MATLIKANHNLQDSLKKSREKFFGAVIFCKLFFNLRKAFAFAEAITYIKKRKH